jgi:hypothetical protein
MSSSEYFIQLLKNVQPNKTFVVHDRLPPGMIRKHIDGSMQSWLKSEEDLDMIEDLLSYGKEDAILLCNPIGIYYNDILLEQFDYTGRGVPYIKHTIMQLLDNYIKRSQDEN